MAKTKIKFDLDNFFFAGQHTNAEREAFMKTPAFPVAVAAYNACEQQLRVGKFGYIGDSDTINDVALVSPLGFNIASINFSGGEIQLFVAQNPWSISRSRVISTSNPKYVVNKLSKNSEHDARSHLIGRCDAARGLQPLSQITFNFLGSAADTLIGSGTMGVPRINYGRWSPNEDLLHYTALYFAGEVSKLEIPNETVKLFETFYSEYLAKRSKFHETIKTTIDMFSGDKWLIINDINGGVIVGSLSHAPILKAIETMGSTGRWPNVNNYSYVEPVDEFKWYKSFDSIPEEVKSQIEMSLMMLKTHTNSTTLFPTVRSGEWISTYAEMGAVVSESFRESKMYMLHK